MIDLVHLVGTHVPRWAARFYPDLLWRMPGHERVAYFTFDDGPTPSLTGRLLDVLARFEAPASFFVLGRHARRDPGLVRALAAAGHTVGNHTFTHPDAWATAEAHLVEELERTTGLLEDLLAQPVRWMRPPYGRFTYPMRRWCQLRRQRCTMWDVGPGDYLPGATAHAIEQRILRAIRPGSIIVLHDNPRADAITPHALADVLARLRDLGWTFAALAYDR